MSVILKTQEEAWQRFQEAALRSEANPSIENIKKRLEAYRHFVEVFNAK